MYVTVYVCDTVWLVFFDVCVTVCVLFALCVYVCVTLCVLCALWVYVSVCDTVLFALCV